MWHDLHPQGLVPAERDLAGLLTRAGRGGSGHRDDAKQRADESSPSTPGGGPRLPRRLVAVLVAGALLLGAGLATAVAMTRARAETTPPPVVAASASEAAPAPGTSSGTSPASEPSPTAPATSAAPPPSPAPTTAPNPIPISTGAAAPAIDPALDPARIYGYRVTATRTLIKVGKAATIPADDQVGSSYRFFWRCLAGTCKLDPWTFNAASPDYSQTNVDNGWGDCGPVTTALAIVRVPDGTYTGTLSVTPRATSGERPGAYCSYPQTVDALSLQPVIKLAPDAAPNASLPAALDPVRITGYQGTSSVDGKTTAATVACEGGVCQLRCFPVCATPVVVQAAADTWSAEGLKTPAACQGGTTSLKLVRAADGSYTGKATTTYVGEPRQGCATSTSFSLQPVTG